MPRLSQFASAVESAVRGFYRDRGPTMAASLAFYGLFSGFPMLLLSVTICGLFLGPDEAASRVQEVIGEYVPLHARLIENAVKGAVNAGSVLTLVSVVALAWSGSRIFAHAINALNDAWDVEHNYAIRERAALEAFLLAAAVFVISTGLLYEAAWSSLWDPEGSRYLPQTGAWRLADDALVQAFGLLVVASLYRFLPHRQVYWRDVLPGALVAIVLFQASQEAFEFYVGHYGGRYNETYGPLSAIAIVLIWAYIAAVIFIFGAHFSASWARLQGRRAPEEEARLVERLEAIRK